MKIAYRHLLNLLIEKPSIEDISNKLFQLGHEHEIDNYIFDIEFTPNRGDCLSLLGLARDLNVFYAADINLPIYKKIIPQLDLKFKNHAPLSCPEISFLNIEIKDQVTEYNDYLENYFTDLKLNKNNFFTDVSNYIAYEMGQPTHSYDFNSIKGEIILKDNSDNGFFKTLLGKNIELKGSDLVFVSQDSVINLAGIVGGIDTACSVNTRNALIECAFFNPESIIGKSIKYDIHSDASHKFERGVDPKCHDKVLRRFIQIVEDHAEITKLEVYKESNLSSKEVQLNLDVDRVNNILGLDVKYEDYIKSLTSLGFKIDKSIRVPSYRSDINNQNDLAEELARVIGYDNIPPRAIKIPSELTTPSTSNEEKIKSFLINHGFSEVINSPFCSSGNSTSIQVDNPLDSNRKYLRNNIIDSLIENVIYNEKRQKDSIKLFEISDIYSLDSSIKVDRRLSVVISGRQGHNFKDFNLPLNEKYLLELFKKINLNLNGEIKNILRDKLNSKIKTPIFVIDKSLTNISNYFDDYEFTSKLPNNFVQYVPISEFPSSLRDFSFSVEDYSKIEEVLKKLKTLAVKNLKHSFMFDFYENKKTNTIKIGYRFIFQSHKKTLTEEEINKSIDNILKPILSIDSVSLPGKYLNK